MRRLVIMSSDHTLLPEQKEILESDPVKYDILRVPQEGWTYEKIFEVAGLLTSSADQYCKEDATPVGLEVIFISPIPALIKILTLYQGLSRKHGYSELEVLIFHNDNREATELPSGKIIHKIAAAGWRLV